MVYLIYLKRRGFTRHSLDATKKFKIYSYFNIKIGYMQPFQVEKKDILQIIGRKNNGIFVLFHQKRII